MQFASLTLLFLGAAAVTSAPVESDANSNIIAAITSRTSREAPVLSQLDHHISLRDNNNNENNNNNNNNCKGGNGNNNNCSSNKNTCNNNQNSCSRSDDRKNTNCCCR